MNAKRLKEILLLGLVVAPLAALLAACATQRGQERVGGRVEHRQEERRGWD